MSNKCEVIRDLLPLYADDVCSESSRLLIEHHLKECPDCAAELEKIRSDEIEENLREEKDRVIEYQAKRFRRRSTTVGSVVSGLFMVPILVCLIVNLSTGHALDWFYVVLAGLAVCASLVLVPLISALTQVKDPAKVEDIFSCYEMTVTVPASASIGYSKSTPAKKKRK